MSDQPHDHLDQARVHAGLSHPELWLRYFELGGMGDPVEVEAYLHGVLLASDHEHDVLAHAINERCVELGGNHPVPLLPRLDPDRWGTPATSQGMQAGVNDDVRGVVGHGPLLEESRDLQQRDAFPRDRFRPARREARS